MSGAILEVRWKSNDADGGARWAAFRVAYCGIGMPFQERTLQIGGEGVGTAGLNGLWNYRA
jgi:hypothetical protein